MTATLPAAPQQLLTDRLILRRWQETDIAPFAALNNDADVMEFFPNRLNYEQSAAMVERIQKCFADQQLGLWAVAEKSSGDFIGFVGLSKPTFEAHFTPCVEVGWRLAKPYWGKGYAVEAAKAAMSDGFERLKLAEIVSFTARVNLKSIRVMQKLKMTATPGEEFLHPVLPADHPLCLHVLYRLPRH